MHSQHLPMTWEAYELLPRHPGWKCEYWDGQAHLSPRHRSAAVSVAVAPRPVVSPCPLRRVVESDAEALQVTYLAAFADTIEYCDWEAAQIENSAGEAIGSFFAGKYGEVLPASRVAVDESAGDKSHRIAGAALVTRGRAGNPLLRMLFVAPLWQRRGLGTALVSSVLNELHRAGEHTLRSRYHLGNDLSLAWHRKFGFVEEPDLSLAELYYHCAHHELWRREKTGDLTESERARLHTELERWHKQVEELHRIADVQGIETVMPSLWDY